MNAHGLGRLPAADERDHNYPLRALVRGRQERISRRWWTSPLQLDQGTTPQCVAYSWLHWLAAGPVTQRPLKDPELPPEALYRRAQEVDEWPGIEYDGTSVRAGAKVLQSLGYVANYHWALTFDDLVTGLLNVGPMVVGTNWYESMFEPTDQGFIGVGGGNVGGHAYLLYGVNTINETIFLKNSWGSQWGLNGKARMKFSAMRQLLAEDGEACIATEVRLP